MGLKGKDIVKFLFIVALFFGLVGISSGRVHKVGNAAGWNNNGKVNYTRWANSRMFNFRDKLVFKYDKRFDKVIQVSREDYHKCNSASPIAVHNSGKDIIFIRSRHAHYYFICGDVGHCKAGQKVDIRVLPRHNVRGKSPLPSVSSGKVHKVGDIAGWNNEGKVNYTHWANSRTFNFGDKLVFEYDNRFDKVIQVSREDYHKCSSSSPIAVHNSGKDIIFIHYSRHAHYYFICGDVGHCKAGQKVDIRVLPRHNSVSPPWNSPLPSASSAPHLPGLGLGVGLALVLVTFIFLS